MRLVLVIALAGTLAVAPAGTLGSSHFAISVSPAIDTPDRTETFQGSQYTINELGRVDPGGSIGATTSGASGTDYDVVLYNSDQSIFDRRDEQSDHQYSFPTGGYEPGSYIVALSVSGSIEAIEPVVIRKFEIEVSAPSSAAPGSTINVSATLTEIASGNTLDRVRAVVGDDGESVRATLSQDSGSTYSGTVDVSSLSTGSYDLYVVAQSPDEIYSGGQELLGASDTQAFDIESQTPTPTPTPTESDSDSEDDGGGSGGGGGGGESSPPPASSGTATSTAGTATSTPGTATSTSTSSSTEVSTPSGGTSSPSDRGTASGGSTATATDDGVITPNEQTPTGSAPTGSGGQPGFGVTSALLALAAMATLAHRRLR